MTDTKVPEEVVTKEKTVLNEATDKSVVENTNFEMSPDHNGSGMQATTLKLPDIEEVPQTNESKITQETTASSQEYKDTVEAIQNSNVDQYDDVEEEYEEKYEEDGETKVAVKKRILRVKKSMAQKNEKLVKKEEIEEASNEGGQRKVTKKRSVQFLSSELVKQEKNLEKEESEEVELDGMEEIRTIRKSQFIKEPDEEALSYEEIEEEYLGSEVDENSDSVTTTKKRIIKIPKQKIEGQREEKHEKVKIVKSETERSLEEEGISREEVEIEEEKVVGEEVEVTSEGDNKKEREGEKGIEEADEKEIKAEEGEKKAASSLSSEEILLAEEKIAMAQQYEVLTKLRNEHITLKRKNLFLNSKLVQYFRKQKMDHVFTEIKEDPALEQQYLKKLTLFYETNKQMTEEKLKINTEWEAQRNINEALLEKVKQGWDELFSRKKEIAAKLIDPKTGRIVPCDKTIEDLINRQEAQLKLISECRLAQIKLKRRIEDKKIERQMQHAGKEFNIMDYEKLSSLKEYYMDKITERDIEIEEVSQKMVAFDNTLIHLKEQLQKKEKELEREQERLQKITLELNNKRANLNVLKTARHKTEKNTAKIKQQSGLLAYPILLKDYEDKTHQLQLLMSQTEELKQVHRAAVVRIRKLRETVKRRSEDRESLGVSLSTITTSNDKSMF